MITEIVAVLSPTGLHYGRTRLAIERQQLSVCRGIDCP